MIRARVLKLLTKAGVAALFLAGLATAGNAQNAVQGKFTLPFETHWGGATLPAGDYTLRCHPQAIHTNFTSEDRQPPPSSWPLHLTKKLLQATRN